MPISKVKTGSITDSAITSDKIQDGSIVNADISPSAAIDSGKLTVDTSALESDINKNAFNISLLGFKMAVNEGLTVFNLVDGVVDEFNDESGIDEAEGSNDNYCGTDDFYRNASPVSISAGFGSTTITEPDTSTAGASPEAGSYTQGSFTVPGGITSIDFKMWGAGGAAYCTPSGPNPGFGGGGGFASGTLAVTPGQVLYTGGSLGGTGYGGGFGQFNTGPCTAIRGGHLVSLNSTPLSETSDTGETTAPAPSIFAVAGSGGAGSYGGGDGGAGGGTTGDSGGQTIEQTGNNGQSGGGGDQEQGGQAGSAPVLGPSTTSGAFLEGGAGGNANAGNGGAGYYGGGGGGAGSGADGAGGGGSSYTSHPQITSGTTEEGSETSGGGTADPAYVAGTNEGSASKSPGNSGEPGYVLLTATGIGSAVSTTIVSDTFTSTSVATSARVVVFEEDIDTPTLNTDIIASVSRDGTNFTNATLSDSGYVTGSSGQRILTGQADISGQPSGQSMRWKLALANNTVKIHGVSLQWS